MTQPIGNSHSQQELIQPDGIKGFLLKTHIHAISEHVCGYAHKTLFLQSNHTWINLTMPICLHSNASLLLTPAVDVIYQTHGTLKEYSGFTKAQSTTGGIN